MKDNGAWSYWFHLYESCAIKVFIPLQDGQKMAKK
jgi:hypothetical protein